MTHQEPDHATRLLARVNEGDQEAVDELLPLVYERLRAVAGNYFQAQTPDNTLQPTALVHEAYVKLMAAQDQSWEGQAHFAAVASKAMRQILQDRARRRSAAKRGGGEAHQVPLDQVETPSGQLAVGIVALDDALEKLTKLNEQQARIVELRFFGGLSVEQVAHVLGIGVRTVGREWRHARLWLRRELNADDDE